MDNFSVDFKYIDTKEQLNGLIDLIKSLDSQDYIALDSEFIRIQTYYPILALLQLKIRDEIYIIDSIVVDVTYLIDAINHTNAYILVFAGDEDIEIIANISRLSNLNRTHPLRVYDVQIMPAFLNIAYKRGLDKEVEMVSGVKLLKDCTLSLWLDRPLSKNQLEYAACDVKYLDTIFNYYREKMNAKLFSWFEDYMLDTVEGESKDIEEDIAHYNVSGAGALNKLELTRLSYICKARLKEAKNKNVALNQVITTKALWQIAKFCPKTYQDLNKCGVKWGCVREYGNFIIARVNEAMLLKEDPNVLPPLDKYSHIRDYKNKFNHLHSFLRKRAYECNISKELLDSKKLIQDFFLQHELGNVPALEKGFRKEILGDLSAYL